MRISYKVYHTRITIEIKKNNKYSKRAEPVWRKWNIISIPIQFSYKYILFSNQNIQPSRFNQFLVSCIQTPRHTIRRKSTGNKHTPNALSESKICFSFECDFPKCLVLCKTCSKTLSLVDTFQFPYLTIRGRAKCYWHISVLNYSIYTYNTQPGAPKHL